MNIKKLRKELIDLYRKYYKNKTDKEVQEYARKIYWKYDGATPVLDESMQEAINLLVDIGYETGVNAPSNEQIKEIIKKLKEEK